MLAATCQVAAPGGRLIRVFWGLTVFLSAVPATLQGQQTDRWSISGRVVGDQSEALAGVRVELVELGWTTVTDDGGEYRISGVAEGDYSLRFGALDRSSAEREVSVQGVDVIVPDVRLSVSAIPMRPLEVVEQRVRLAASTERVPGSARVLDARDLEAAITAYDDVHQILRRVPGVNIQEEDGYGLRPNIGMRGSGSDRSSKITLMEDGVLIAPAPYAAPSAYYFPVAGRMEAVEVRKGSSQIKYGPRTIGGALNLVSSSIPTVPFEWRGEVAGAANTTGRARVALGGSTRSFGWLLESFQITTEGFKQLPSEEGTGFELHDYVAKLRLNSDPSSARFYQQVELKLGVYDERSNETYLGLTDPDFAVGPLRRYAASQEDVMNADHTQIQLRHFLRVGEIFDVTTTAYRNDFSRNWYKLQSVGGASLSSVLDEPASFPAEMAILRGEDSPGADLLVRANNRVYYSQGIQTAIAVQFDLAGLEHEVEIGARFHRDQEDRFQHEDGFRMSSGRMLLERVGAPGSQSNRVSDARARAFYVEDRVDLGHLALTPGLRFETVDFRRTDYAKDDPARSAGRIRENRVSAVLPGIGATLDLGSGARLFSGVHRGFGPPGPGANQATEPERSLNYEFGFAVDRGELTAQLVGFYNDYENIVGASTLASGGDGTGDTFNGGAADIWGVEASADLGLSLGREGPRLPLQLAYTFTRATFGSSFTSDFDPWGTVRDGDEMPYVPRHQLFGSVGVAGRSWRVGVEVAAASAMRTLAGQGPGPGANVTDPFVTVSVGGQYDVAGWGTLFVGVQNLTDERHIVARRPAGARPGLPRTIEAGVRIGT